MVHPLRKKWQQCEKIAAQLNLRKEEVFYNLYEDLVEHDLITAILDGEKPNLDHLSSYCKLMEKKKICAEPTEQLKLAMWFIQKVGSAERAKIVIDAASKAMQALDKKSKVSNHTDQADHN